MSRADALPEAGGEARSSPYLPPEAARGCRYCFDPHSPSLRRALTGPSPQPDTPLVAADLAADLEFLHRLLKRQYAGYPDLLQQRDFDADRFFTTWVDGVRRAGPEVSFRQGVVEPLAALRAAHPDNHFTFSGADWLLDQDERLVVHEFQAVLDRPQLDLASLRFPDLPGVRWGTLRRAPLLRADGTTCHIVTVSGAGGQQTLRLDQHPGEHDEGDGLGGLHLQRRPATPPPAARAPEIPAYEWRVVGDTSVVTLRSFFNRTAVYEALARFVADFPRHATQPRILFDLRGNGGGTLGYVQQWLQQAVHGSWRSYPRLEIVAGLWPCSRWNQLVMMQIQEGRVDDALAAEERERLRASWPVLPPSQPTVLDAGDRPGRAAHTYGGQVFVLIDRHAGSSGELAALELKAALGATILGERSRGTMQYGEVQRFVLPRTGVLCQVPTKRFYFDGEVESVGVAVNCYLQQIDQDAGEVVPHLSAVSEMVQEMG
ncbi:MAG TPA: S41 family peptidase [Chloroflexota bacterium]|nr:S41 family peptidase [Chloroflexota bacterium]